MLHELVFHKDIIGLDGYNHDGVFALVANGDDHFLQHGIAEKSLVIIDPKLTYSCEHLNVFYDADNSPTMRLAKEELPGCKYRGRVLFAISQFS